MARGAFPSMTALLGLLAVAGYQNRDKLSEMIGNRAGGGSGDRSGGAQARPGGLDGLLGGLAGAAGGGGLGSILGGGLGELTDRFRQSGQGETVDSWVGKGPNKTVAPRDLEQAIGPDVLDDLTQQTGLSRDELLARLSRELPNAVDQYTPDGRVPNDDDTRG
ncbi:MAG: DUF937 domain-containing protein [Rhodobacteraceae bacterium]|nr:DUF937 domain-containing protein [Paracoccaceae bacterium]